MSTILISITRNPRTMWEWLDAILGVLLHIPGGTDDPSMLAWLMHSAVSGATPTQPRCWWIHWHTLSSWVVWNLVMCWLSSLVRGSACELQRVAWREGVVQAYLGSAVKSAHRRRSRWPGAQAAGGHHHHPNGDRCGRMTPPAAQNIEGSIRKGGQFESQGCHTCHVKCGVPLRAGSRNRGWWAVAAHRTARCKRGSMNPIDDQFSGRRGFFRAEAQGTDVRQAKSSQVNQRPPPQDKVAHAYAGYSRGPTVRRTYT
jgi:hypothetical protein